MNFFRRFKQHYYHNNAVIANLCVFFLKTQRFQENQLLLRSKFWPVLLTEHKINFCFLNPAVLCVKGFVVYELFLEAEKLFHLIL